MPYKDKEKAKQASKERMRKHRAQQKGVTSDGVTPKTVTPDPPCDDELFSGVPEQCRIYANGELGGEWYRRLIHHLKTTSIEDLQTEGIFIPCWRYAQEQQQEKVA